LKFTVKTNPPHEIEADALALNLFDEDTSVPKELLGVEDRTHGAISHVLKAGSDSTRFGGIQYFPYQTALPAGNLLLAGSGTRSEFDFRRAIDIAGRCVRELTRRSIGKIAIMLRGPPPARKLGMAVAEGCTYAVFNPGKYRTTGGDHAGLSEVIAMVGDVSLRAEFEAGIKLGQIYGEAQNYTRELVNEPSNVLTPRRFASEARELARRFRLDIDVLGPDKMRRLGMNALLGVARGSEEPPQLIVVRYRARKPGTSTVALVGKGLTFDTGGVSLKDSEGMHYMKYDMAGGAAVLGAMRIIAETKPSINVLGLVAATENMPGGRAQKPGDVVTSLNKKTIEVLNTDAEGRLVLADAIAYAKRLGATRIVDVATLTGAVVTALGETTAGVLGNDQEFVDKVLMAAQEVGERMWQLPLFPEYRDLIQSEIADMTNIANRTIPHTRQRPAGAIVGGVFLSEFAEDTPWVHIDIAGTAWKTANDGWIPKGPTGVAVKTLAKTVEMIGGSPP
jgi:leucyl aminopeptidase